VATLNNSGMILTILLIVITNQISDVARPLSYKTTYFFKTKTTFSRPRPLF